jgi:hydroxyacylglutathione hydrolase
MEPVPAMPMTVTAVPCLSDNYAWMLRAPDGRLAVCDPGEAAPVLAAAEAAGGRIAAILLTHHHGDHVAGVAEIVAKTGAKVIGAAADAHRLPPLDLQVRPGDAFDLLGSEVRVLASDGHTRGHVAFHIADSAILLCGDTLFSLGCGRLLEGTAEEMFASLQAIAALPAETLVCCGHEYTESNARFALTVEADNPTLQERAERVARLRATDRATVPTTIEMELSTNPFLRAKDVATLARIRAAKDTFR